MGYSCNERTTRRIGDGRAAGVWPSEKDAVLANSTDRSLDPLRQIFLMYRPAYWFFEIIGMLRRIIMMCTLIFVKGEATRAGIGFLLAFLSAATYRELVPFSTIPANALSTVAHWQICPVYFTGACPPSCDHLNGRS